MRYLFKNFVLDLEKYQLLKDGRPLKAEPQIIELLTLMVSNQDRMLGKDEINRQIWKGRVVTDSALSSRIKSMRQLLGDSGKSQQIIQTVHGKGFRFVAEVTLEETAPAPESFTDANVHARHSRPNIAVMPFLNLSPSKEEEYFSEGISSDIITHLSRHRWLNVIARNTSFGYKGKTMDARQVGKELNAGYLVEGSVRRSSERVRITVSLIDARTGFQVWSEQYDRDATDLFDVQDEITQMITARLEPEIGYAERHKVVISRPANLQVWDCYQLGIYHFYEFSSASNRQAQMLLKEAQKLDENFAESFAWWAYAVVLGMVYWDTEPSQALLDQALSACNRALSLDRQNATFHSLKARVHLARCEYNEAIDENHRAIKLNPTFAAAHCGMGDSLAYEGRYDEAIDHFDRAISLSPNDPQLWAFYSYGALALIFNHDFNRALRWSELAASIPNCQYWAIAHQAVALALLGRIEESELRAVQLLHSKPGFSQKFARRKMFYLKRPEQVELYLNGLELAGIPLD
ncbi:MAG: tetratricopeptide repeat protein [Pseudohongiellaceae bacterium]